MKSIKEVNPDQIEHVKMMTASEYANGNLVQGVTDENKRKLLATAFNEGAELATEIIRISQEIYEYAQEKFGNEPFSVIFLDRDARPFFHCFSKLYPSIKKYLYPISRGITGDLSVPIMRMKDAKFNSVPYDVEIYFKYLDKLCADQNQHSFGAFVQIGVRALNKVINEKHGKPKTKNVLVFDTGRNGTLMEFTHWYLKRQFPEMDYRVEKLFLVSSNPNIDGLERYDPTNPKKLTDWEWKVKHPVSIRLDEDNEKVIYGDIQEDYLAQRHYEPGISHTKAEGHSFMFGILETTKRIVNELLKE